MKFKTLKNKITGEWGIMMDKKIIITPIPLLMPMYITWKQVQNEKMENEDQYRLVVLVVNEISGGKNK